MIATFLRHGSNAILVALLLGVTAFLVFGEHAVVTWGVLVGAALFFASEYSTHRFLFHAVPSSKPAIRWLQHRLHYDHHVDPPQLNLLFLPWWFVLPTALAYGAIFLAVARNFTLAGSLLAGSLAALLWYEWVHYVAHIPYQPKTRWGRFMKKYHLWHHFKNEHYWFGVTNPGMDALVGTWKNVEAVERSTTVRDLYGDYTA